MHHYLVATYRHERFIAATLESIRAQYASIDAFEREARVFVLDDASPDDTQSVLQEWREHHANIAVRRNAENLGASRSRNALLEWWRSTQPDNADFVLFVDGDDLLAEDSLAIKLAAFAADPALQVVGGQLGWFSDIAAREIKPIDTFACDADIAAIANLFECHFYIANALFRAAVFLNGPNEFPETANCEDWLFFTLQSLKMRHVPQITLKYRRHGGNLTRPREDDNEVQTLRRQVRQLALLPIALLPTERDCELLDLVGYLSLRLKWQDGRASGRPQVFLPWFRLLARQPQTIKHWPALHRELGELFEKIILHNRRHPHFHAQKLPAYLDALLAAADQEVSAGDTARQQQVGQAAKSFTIGR